MRTQLELVSFSGGETGLERRLHVAILTRAIAVRRGVLSSGWSTLHVVGWSLPFLPVGALSPAARLPSSWSWRAAQRHVHGVHCCMWSADGGHASECCHKENGLTRTCTPFPLFLVWPWPRDLTEKRNFLSSFRRWIKQRRAIAALSFSSLLLAEL